MIYNESEGRQEVLLGARKLYEAVKTTMGPKGRNIVFENEIGQPVVTHDGVTVAKAVVLEEDDSPAERMGVELVKQASIKMNDTVGDGTTTVTVLTYHILDEANKLIAAGHNPMELRAEVDSAVHDVAIPALMGIAEDVSDDPNKVAHVAVISAGGDATVGNLIAGLAKEVGREGVISVEESGTPETTSEVVEGFTFDRGWMSPYMVTDTNKMEAVYEKPAILVTDSSIASVRDLVPMLEKLAKAGKKDLVIICEDLQGEALRTLLTNHVQGTFNAVVVRAPGIGEKKRDALMDISILTGAQLLSPERSTELAEADIESIGTAAKVIVGEHRTTIIMGAGRVEDVQSHVAAIRAQAEAATSEHDKEYYLKRAAALEGRVGLIKVGGATEAEMQERRFRVDDAVAATKAALAEGIVPGGGTTQLWLAKLMPETLGGDIVRKALEQPFRIILENAGRSPEEYLPEARKADFKGVNVYNGQFTDMKKAGVIDPVVVTRQALVNAASIAGTAMTMGGIITRPKEPGGPKTITMPMGV